jgi:protein-S-isoprenylcysteine O-methyltransferase Ste14
MQILNMKLNKKNAIPVFSVAYLILLFIIVTGYMFDVNYGWLGIFATVVFVIGTLILIAYIYREAMK